MFRLVESVKQSKRKNCEDKSVIAMMCIGKMAGCVVLPRFFPSYGQLPRWSVLGRVMFMDILLGVE